MDQIISELTATAVFSIAVFGIAFSCLQQGYMRLRLSFSVFLGAIALNNFHIAFADILDLLPRKYTYLTELAFGATSSFCLAPAFWLYVVLLTSATQELPKRWYIHLFLPGATALLGLGIAVFSPSLEAVFSTTGVIPIEGNTWLLVVVYSVLQLGLLPQIAIYLFLIVRRLLRHRILLRDAYASTEQHELRWIYLIAGFGAAFWASTILIMILAFETRQTTGFSWALGVSNIVALVMVATTTLWGLRQRPPLAPDIRDAAIPEHGSSAIKPAAEKYEKSALNAQMSARIAQKLRKAMEDENLYRDPNLSLWALAQHIGASPNYISQTLSEEIGENFFDFVNGYRVIEAEKKLSETKETVLAIAYDVGFNARSSFYNAFKRRTGDTPTNYRKKLSQPAGTDD